MTISADRADLLKRLFAVSISVGFASRMASFFSSLYAHGHDPNPYSVVLGQWRELSLLVISLVAVILSWEFYFNKIRDHPLEDLFRFVCDLTIVFLYLILMLASEFFKLWFDLLVVIFVLYAIWDIGVALAAKNQVQGADEQRIPFHKIGVVVTLKWLLTLGLIVHFKALSTNIGFAAAELSTLLVLVLYRFDQKIACTGWIPYSPAFPVIIIAAQRLVW